MVTKPAGYKFIHETEDIVPYRVESGVYLTYWTDPTNITGLVPQTDIIIEYNRTAHWLI